MSFNKDRRFNDNSILTREECIEIYRRTTMGKRVAESLVNFAMSVEREINIQEAEPEVVEEFKKVSKELKQDNSIKSTLIMSRVMGVAGLFVAIRDKETLQEDHKIVPTFNEIDNYDIKFNVMDKLPLSGTVIETRPLSFNFLDIKKISIGTNTISKKRIALSMPNTPIYLENTSDLIPYSAPSVYYNMVRLLDEYEEAIYCLSILLYKAGVITYKYEPNGKMAGVKIDAEMRSKEIIDQIRNGQVLAVSNKTDLVDFPINNVSGLIQAIDKLEEAITKALNDTPASILFDKNLSHGLSEGTEDMKSVIMAIESFREEKLKPLYNLTDFYVMLVAWNNAFTKEIQLKYPEKYAGWTLDKMRRSWVESFSFEFGNLFPEPESEKLRKNSMYLDNLLKVKQLGGLTSDIQAELNESKIFNNDIELDETQAQNMGMESSFDSGGFEKQGFNKPPQADSIGGLKVDDAEFEEEHPRDEDGRFVKGNGKNDSKEEIKEEENKENNDNNAVGYKKNIQALPEDLRDIGEKLYSGKYKGGEFVEGITFVGKTKEDVIKEIKENLSELEASIFAYTYDDADKLNDAQVDKIVKLIDNSPMVNKPLYRGQKGCELQNLKVGDEMPMYKINSFSADKDTAEDFASIKGGKYPTIITINKPCKALNIQPLSYYTDSEEEYLVGDGYIVDEIREEELQGVKTKVITIKPKKESE